MCAPAVRYGALTLLGFIRSVLGDDPVPEPPIHHRCADCGATYAVTHAMWERCGGSIREVVGRDYATQ